jgi:hypothetical protein
VKARHLQFRRNADRNGKQKMRRMMTFWLLPLSMTADPTEEELEAIEPIQVRKVAAY